MSRQQEYELLRAFMHRMFEPTHRKTGTIQRVEDVAHYVGLLAAKCSIKRYCYEPYTYDKDTPVKKLVREGFRASDTHRGYVHAEQTFDSVQLHEWLNDFYRRHKLVVLLDILGE